MKLKSSFIWILAALPLLGACSGEDDKANILYADLKAVNKIQLAGMSVSKMASIDDLDIEKAKGMQQTGAALLDAIKIGKRKAAYSYETYLRAYVDMSGFTPDDIYIDEDAKTITIVLPPIMTEYEGRDVTFREDHYRVTGLRSEIKPGERAILKERMNEALKKEVESNPAFRNKIIQTAKTKGESFFSSIAATDGYAVVVNFREGGAL